MKIIVPYSPPQNLKIEDLHISDLFYFAGSNPNKVCIKDDEGGYVKLASGTRWMLDGNCENGVECDVDYSSGVIRLHGELTVTPEGAQK